MKGTNNALTTGQVATVAGVSPRTVSKWFDKGLLVGYRIPSTKDRRVPRAEMIRFLREHGMPLADLSPDADPVVLAVGLDDTTAKLLAAGLGWSPRLVRVGDPFAAGVMLRDERPAVVVADDSLGADGLRWLVAAVAHEAVPVLALVGADVRVVVGDPLHMADVFRHPLDVPAVVGRVRTLVASRTPASIRSYPSHGQKGAADA